MHFALLQWPLDSSYCNLLALSEHYNSSFDYRDKNNCSLALQPIHLSATISFHGSGAVLLSLPPTLSEPLRNSDPSRATTISSRSQDTTSQIHYLRSQRYNGRTHARTH